MHEFCGPNLGIVGFLNTLRGYISEINVLGQTGYGDIALGSYGGDNNRGLKEVPHVLLLLVCIACFMPLSHQAEQCPTPWLVSV
jgi:hypothetical protein